MIIIITGSYNGQDSLGDECLLKVAIARVQEACPQARLVVHLLNPDTPFMRHVSESFGVSAENGLQSSMWRFAHVLVRLRAPEFLARFLSERCMWVAELAGIFGARASINSLRSADAFFIFGGTQFSGQWFKLNAPAYLRSAKIVRSAGGRVFFGPQQYGPLTPEDATTLRKAFNSFVSDWRTRNHLDLDLLEPGAPIIQNREVYDEVFSALRFYPPIAPRERTHILVNLRNTTFDDDSSLEADRYRAFADMLDQLIERYDLPLVFFAVSDASFCDDNAAFAILIKLSRNAHRMTSVGRVRDEYHLFELAQYAKCTISMSFHGCLLAGMCGSPFVPVTEGRYYDYKYADFDKYTGGQRAPLIGLSEDMAGVSERVSAYVDGFVVETVNSARTAACGLADDFYERALAI